MLEVRRFAIARSVARLVPGFVLAATVMLNVGCKNNKAQDEAALLNEEVLNVRAELAERNRALEASRDELRDRDIELAQLRSERDDLQRQLGDAESNARSSGGFQTGFENISGVSGEFSPGEVTAVVESDVLFASGKAALRSQAKSSLNAVANVLNSTYGGNSIRIVGHTDSDPIKKSGHKSNYHLGFERAYAVRQYLVSRGVSADRITVASRGPDEPQGSKSQSRRVEIVVQLDS